MHAYVYKSQRKADTYVYLATRDAFDVLPEAVRTQLGTLTFVLDFALTPDRKLARENPALVRERLRTQGFHLQMPPRAVADPLTEDWGTDA
ncbi:MAG: YcgL domain-containing protein [Luteimonas sp.]